MTEFRIWWLDYRGERYDSCVVRRRDLTDAIRRASSLIRSNTAHGFFVAKGALADGETITR